MEDAFHAVVVCPHARDLRHAMRKYWTLPKEDLVNSGPDWLLLLLDRYDAQTCANFLMLIWRCWSVRNAVLKAGESVSVEGSVVFLIRYRESLLLARQQEVEVDARGRQKVHKKRWMPPAVGALKVNVDGAFYLETGDAGLGVVVRDDAGQLLLMASRRIFHSLPDPGSCREPGTLGKEAHPLGKGFAESRLSAKLTRQRFSRRSTLCREPSVGFQGKAFAVCTGGICREHVASRQRAVTPGFRKKTRCISYVCQDQFSHI
ncbi:hypothetical protein HU200_038039 [Digitaria exilis]|uniref:RNase H type-1 domain-containing protein n=1 Tax=Digitaria exilis TaxID=1010633 RepID=A0A835BEP7_9POAL|nr:hypothetical protein HU200_038039 [Digitaria exilis]